MPNSTSVYIAKKAAALSNPLTNPSVFLQSDNSSWAAFVAIQSAVAVAGTSLIDGVPFRLRASGRVVVGSGGTSTFTPGLYYISASVRTTVASPASGTQIAGTASTALSASTTYPWMIEATCIWDSVSETIGGWYTQTVGIAAGVTTQAILINNTQASTALDSTPGGAGFQATALFGTSRTGNSAVLSTFTAEVL